MRKGFPDIMRLGFIIFYKPSFLFNNLLFWIPQLETTQLVFYYTFWNNLCSFWFFLLKLKICTKIYVCLKYVIIFNAFCACPIFIKYVCTVYYIYIQRHSRCMIWRCIMKRKYFRSSIFIQFLMDWFIIKILPMVR